MIQGSKYITYNQQGGRSGHALRDMFTCYTLASVVDGLVVLPQEKWNETTIHKSGSLDGQVLINFDTDESQSMINKGNFSKIITIKAGSKQWGGMCFDYFSNLKKQIENAPQGSLVVLTGVIRLSLVQLTNWYNKKLIERDSFAVVLPVLRNLFQRSRSQNNRLFVYPCPERRYSQPEQFFLCAYWNEMAGWSF